MTGPMKIVVAGVGAFGQKHLDAVKLIGGVEVASIVGRELAPTEDVARKYGVPHATTDLAEALRRPGVEAVMPRLGINGLVSVGDTTLSFTGQGVDPAKDLALAAGLPMVAGTRLRSDDYDGVLLGEGLAENLGVKPGDKLALLVTAANGTFKDTCSTSGDFPFAEDPCHLKGSYGGIDRC